MKVSLFNCDLKPDAKTWHLLVTFHTFGKCCAIIQDWNCARDVQKQHTEQKKTNVQWIFLTSMLVSAHFTYRHVLSLLINY